MEQWRNNNVEYDEKLMKKAEKLKKKIEGGVFRK